MRRALFAILICSACVFAKTAHAQAVAAEVPLQVSFQPESTEYIEPFYRAYVTAGTVKFSFIVPQGFRLQGDPASGRFILSNADGDCSLSFAILGPMPADGSGLNTDLYRTLVLRQRTNAIIQREFSSHAAGKSGPAFDLQWKAAAEITQCKRSVFIPSSAGVLEFTATAGSTSFSKAQGSLGTILGTFCYSMDGKLKVKHMSDKT
jgi:hypothetical protein